MNDEKLAKVGLSRLNIDPYRLTWNRVTDTNDRALRKVMVGLGPEDDGRPRQTGFDITVASEIMAILALVNGTDYKSALRDLRQRAGRTVIGTNKDGKPITLDDLGVAGAVTVLMKDALHPNLLQTLEGQPAFVHAGPFANIAHGNSSILADQLALRLGDYVVTESGFGADIGMEKFFDIKCRASGLIPDCVVLVATIRALKMHGGGPRVIPGRPLDKAYTDENVALLEKGMANMVAHIRNAKRFGVPVVVAVNKFHTDTAAEIAAVEQAAVAAGAETAVMSDHWAHGGDGAVALAEAVAAACEKPSNFEFLYPLDLPIKAKIETIAKQIYSAGEIIYEPQAEKQIKSYEDNGFGNLPICMAKTHLSISHDPALKNAPSGYTLTVREVRASVGAGFIYPLLGEMRTMPGLGTRPAYMNVDIDENGRVMGLF
jgi:methylenetetrahydrofolate dehydrogenase (NADP+)/methenyltetrahydrofolate cyclohydrolase/formyltetrahydrofolate synthetase